MNYLKYFESNEGDILSHYLSKIGATKEDIMDIFQGIIDIGYDVKFQVKFINSNGKARATKNSSKETPRLTIRFNKTTRQYVGGPTAFNNLDYLENLYHSLSMFISMYGSKCDISYELDNMIDLNVICLFPTEYDDTKISISKDDLDKLVEKTLDPINKILTYSDWNGFYTYSTTPQIHPSTSYTKVYIEANTEKLIDLFLELANTDLTYIDNQNYLKVLKESFLNRMSDILTSQYGKVVVFRNAERSPDHYRGIENAGSGFYSEEDNVKIISVDFDYVTEIDRTFTYKSGFLRKSKISIYIESLVIKMKIV